MEHYTRALRTDFEQILGSFQVTNSVRYEEFSRIWREMNFSSIFHGLSLVSEKRTFIRLALSIASPYLFPPYTFQIRVGGLYLLYGLFYSQLISPEEKIRLALKDWDELMRFQQDAANAQHYDVVFILKKLLSEKAVYFTAMPNPLCCDSKRKLKDGQKLSEMFVDRPSGPQELINKEMLEELANVHGHYEKLKRAVSSQIDKPELSLVKQNLVPKLRDAVVSYYSWQENQTECESQSDQGAGEGTSSKDESSQRARLLESIKSRSYGQAVEASRSRRHRQVQVSSAATEPVLPDLAFKSKVLSLKERTKLNFQNQGDQKEALAGVTRLWRLCAAENEKTEENKKRRFKWSLGSDEA